MSPAHYAFAQLIAAYDYWTGLAGSIFADL